MVFALPERKPFEVFARPLNQVYFFSTASKESFCLPISAIMRLFAMILAFVFITMFGKNSAIKLFTILLVCPYMVFYSDAGIQKMLLLVIIAIVVIYIMELGLRNVRISNGVLIAMVIGLTTIIMLLYLPMMGFGNTEEILRLFQGRILDNQNMHARYVAWNEVLELVKQQGLIGQIFGCGLSIRMDGNLYIESLYIKAYYVLGWMGLALAFGLLIAVIKYIILVKDRKTFFLMIMMVLLLLGSGVAINSMERVQMSWFPMMFAGMVVSSVREKNEEI